MSQVGSSFLTRDQTRAPTLGVPSLTGWTTREVPRSEFPLLPSGFNGKTQSALQALPHPPCSWTAPSVIQGTREPNYLCKCPPATHPRALTASLPAFSEPSLAKNPPSIPLPSTADLLLKRADSSFLPGVQKHSRNNCSSTFSCCVPTLVINLSKLRFCRKVNNKL